MSQPRPTQIKDGTAWPIGDQAEVDWITEQTESGCRISAAIPPRYQAYATLTDHGDPDLPRNLGLERRQDLAFVDVLRRHADPIDWWLGYLNTGASDIVFWEAPRVKVYRGWEYVLVLAGPDQASTWRPAPDGEPNWKSTELPELMFPTDRSWLVSFLWDDDWACIGGPETLITDLLADPILAPNARRADTHQDATPPGDEPG